MKLDAIVRKKDLNLLKEYLDQGNDINEFNELGRSGLDESISNNFKEGALYLIEKGADTSLKNKNGDTVLHIAVKLGMIDIIEAILNQSLVSLNIKDKCGNNVLWMALFNARLKPEVYYPIIELLIEKGADPYSENNAGRNPLYLLNISEDLKSYVHELNNKYKFIRQ